MKSPASGEVAAAIHKLADAADEELFTKIASPELKAWLADANNADDAVCPQKIIVTFKYSAPQVDLMASRAEHDQQLRTSFVAFLNKIGIPIDEKETSWLAKSICGTFTRQELFELSQNPNVVRIAISAPLIAGGTAEKIEGDLRSD
ncbi:hypothetical protein COV82_02980 [Candidatus Peregrinibacteria bacterium CG11_big_fil_rev_8_21_14_0_20_46_8]|nr:MAG: hypothetical protein COV82_02980 [Candidatus Peregrinibacteria bacterium CG11_big_fil_rev_8_21_14_0_20_46_8]